MRRLWLVALLGVCACAKKDAALKLVITVATERPDSCFEVSVTSASTAPLNSSLPRKGSDREYEVVVQQGTNLPDDVQFKVKAWVSANGCAEPRWANGEVTASGHFTKGEITTVEARLDQLPDTDGDHTVDSVDCAPSDATRGQSIAEQCNSRLDLDCDGVIACDDSDCLSRPCVASLALLDGGTATAGQCSSQTLTLLNAGAPEAPATAVPIVMSSAGDGGVTYFSDSNCASPSTTLSVTGATAPFSFMPTRAGPITIQVTSTANYLPANAAYVVNSTAASHCTISPDTLTAELDACSATAQAQFFDAFENGTTFTPVFSVTPASVTVSNPACSGPPTGLTFATKASVPTAYVVTIDGGSFSCSLTGSANHPFPPGASKEWPLEIHVGGRPPDKGYVDYSLMTILDSASATADVHAFHWSGTAWEETTRYITPHDAGQSEVWFRSQTAFADNSINYDYALFVTDAGAAANSTSVFLFTDDFESGNLSRWNLRTAGWEISAAGTNASHLRGSFSLHYADTGGASGDVVIEANLPDERDVFVEAWWNPDDATQFNAAQAVRLQPGVVTENELNWGNGQWGFNTVTAGGSNWQTAVNSTLPNIAYTRIGVAIWGDTMRAWSNGAPLVLADGGTQVSILGGLDGGHIGFRRWQTNNDLYIDDVMVRRYTEPEPQVTVLTPISAPP